jgi:hypothetical protein
MQNRAASNFRDNWPWAWRETGTWMRATTAPMRQVISRVLRAELTPGGQLGQVGIEAVQ